MRCIYSNKAYIRWFITVAVIKEMLLVKVVNIHACNKYWQWRSFLYGCLSDYFFKVGGRNVGYVVWT